MFGSKRRIGKSAGASRTLSALERESPSITTGRPCPRLSTAAAAAAVAAFSSFRREITREIREGRGAWRASFARVIQGRRVV